MRAYRGEQQLEALGDPSRRAIVALLSEAPASVGRLAERLPISRPAVSQHLSVLQAADLVQVRPEGTRRVYSLNTAGTEQIRSYLDTFWRADLQRYAAFVDEQIHRPETP